MLRTKPKSRGERKRRREWRAAKRELKVQTYEYIEPEMPKDGMRRFTKGGHDFEVPVTPEAKEARMDELYARSGSHCEGCGATIYRTTFHPHHWQGRKLGKNCWCMSCLQALCGDVPLVDGTTRYGCHSMAHKNIDGDGKFNPQRVIRLDKPFAREAQ
jgi:hypothetical protein